MKRAVLLSGTSIAGWSLVAAPALATRRLASLLNCSAPHGEGLKACLRKVPLTQLMAAQKQVRGFFFMIVGVFFLQIVSVFFLVGVSSSIGLFFIS